MALVHSGSRKKSATIKAPSPIAIVRSTTKTEPK
jgi:hypothetical protein